MKMGSGKKFMNEVEGDEKKEEGQVKKEEQQTEQLVKMSEEEVGKLEEELKRMEKEAKRNEQDLEAIRKRYEKFTVDLGDSKFEKRLKEAEQMVEKDLNNIDKALNMVTGKVEKEEKQAEKNAP